MTRNCCGASRGHHAPTQPKALLKRTQAVHLVAELYPALLGDVLSRRTIVLHAASKTYNIPGLSCAYAVIPDHDLRERYKHAAR